MTATSLPRPADDEYGQWYAGYIAEVPDGEILKFLETQLREVRSLLATVSEGRGGHRYAEGKWSIKEV
ncbi:MAG: DinB family protein, partial [Gemmatimonadota bacterium]